MLPYLVLRAGEQVNLWGSMCERPAAAQDVSKDRFSLAVIGSVILILLKPSVTFFSPTSVGAIWFNLEREEMQQRWNILSLFSELKVCLIFRKQINKKTKISLHAMMPCSTCCYMMPIPDFISVLVLYESLPWFWFNVCRNCIWNEIQ